jgi:hypothetical protein
MNDLIIYNKTITDIKYFSLTDALNAPIKSRTVFIIANEIIKQSGEIGRYYTVFPSFKDFLKNRDKYKNCHEIFVDHIHNKPNIGGRLVFDFDIKNKNIPESFNIEIEYIIYIVIELYFQDIDVTKF